MSPLTAAGWLASLAIITAYYRMVRSPEWSRPRRASHFDWANALGGVVIFSGQVSAGVYFAAALTAAFTLVGALGVVRSLRGRA